MKKTEIISCFNDIIRLNKCIKEVDIKFPTSDYTNKDEMAEMRTTALNSIYEEYQEVANKISINNSDSATMFIFPIVTIKLNIDLKNDVLNLFDVSIAKLSNEGQVKIILDIFNYFIDCLDWRTKRWKYTT